MPAQKCFKSFLRSPTVDIFKGLRTWDKPEVTQHSVNIAHMRCLHGPQQEVQVHDVVLIHIIKPDQVVERLVVKIRRRVDRERSKLFVSAQQVIEIKSLWFIDGDYIVILL